MNNDSLHEKISGVDELVSDQSKGRGLNRYSFVSDHATSDSYPLLIREVVKQTGERAIAVVCWRTHLPNRSPVAAKVIESRLLKREWSVSLRSDHYIATKVVEPNDIDYWPPLGIDKQLHVGFMLLIGDQAEEHILNVLNDECSSFLARVKYFSPNSEFFKRLESDGDVSVLYNVGNNGIVLLGKCTICIESVRNVDISAPYEGDLAYKAFIQTC